LLVKEKIFNIAKKNNNINIINNVIKNKDMNKIVFYIHEIENKYFIKFVPTKEFYKRLGIGQKRFTLLKENKESPTLTEMQKLKDYFGLNDINQLVENN